jgi:hypothetical protein
MGHKWNVSITPLVLMRCDTIMDSVGLPGLRYSSEDEIERKVAFKHSRMKGYSAVLFILTGYFDWFIVLAF